VNYLHDQKLPGFPTELVTQKLWLSISKLPIKPREQRLLVHAGNKWIIRLGPWADNSTSARLFLMQSPLHRALSRVSDTVLDTITVGEIERAVALLQLPDVQHCNRWRNALRGLLGEPTMGYFSQSITKPYAIAIATRDPFDLRRSIVQLAKEAYYCDEGKAIARLRRAVKDYTTFFPERHPFRDAIEIALEYDL